MNRLDLLQPPGCSARFPLLSFALPILTLNEVNLVVGARLMSLLSREQRMDIRTRPNHNVVSHYDLRLREEVRTCTRCEETVALTIPGDLDDRWRPMNLPDEFPAAYARWVIDEREKHRECLTALAEARLGFSGDETVERK